MDSSCVLLGFHDLQGLSTADHVTLSIVKRYLDFKVCGGGFMRRVNIKRLKGCK